MGKIKIMGFHQTPSTILFDDPHTQTTSPNFTPFQKMRKWLPGNVWHSLLGKKKS